MMYQDLYKGKNIANFGSVYTNMDNPFESADPGYVTVSKLDGVKKEPCSFCKNGFDLFNRVKAPSCRTSGSTAGISIKQEEDETYLILSAQSYLHDESGKVQILYCPWCGRKL